MRILVAIDLWDPEHDPKGVLARALPWARRLGGTVDLLCTRPLEVFPSWHELPAELVTALRAQWAAADAGLAARLEAALAEIPAENRGIARVEHGDPWTELAAFAEGYDLAILLSHARTGVARVWSGSVAERFVARAGGPALILHVDDVPTPPDRTLRLLAAVDMGDGSAEMLARATGWLVRLGPGRIDAVYAQPSPIAPAGLEPSAHATWAVESWLETRKVFEQRLTAELEAAAPPDLRGTAQVRTGAPVQEIAALSEGYDVLVVGSHHRTGLSHLWNGSVSERLVRRAQCAVLVL
jgi:nucleotide-binding universal stress UspA family protein